MSNAESTGDDFTTNMRNRIQEWLQEQGWQVGTEGAPNANWMLTANDRQQRHVSIVQPANRKDQIVIFAGLTVSPEHRAQIAQMPEHERIDLIFTLRNNLILLGAGYTGIGDPLEDMIFDTSIYFDGLSKDSFLKGVTQVRNASILARSIIAQALNNPPPEQEEADQQIGFRPPRD